MKTKEFSSSTPNKVLFITPFFGRTGSEMQLYYILQNLKTDKIKPYLFSQKNGVLLKELPKHIPAFVGYKQHPNLLYRLLRLLLYAVNINPIEFQLGLLQKKIKADYWYVNTIVNPEVYAVAKKMGIKVITHFHELPAAYNNNTANEMKVVVENSHLFIGCSQAVCDKIADMGPKNIKLLYGFIDAGKIKINLDKATARKKVGLRDDDFIWAISGNTILTKGIEFVIPLLKTLKSNAKIIWIGTEADRGINYYVKETIRNNFNGQIIFLGQQKEFYYDYLNCVDAFLLLSREDSFPLVMLEAAYLGKPIASFNSGGVKEFVDFEMGYIVDNWNIETLAETMFKIQKEYSKFDETKIRSKVLPYLAENQIEKLEKILAEF